MVLQICEIIRPAVNKIVVCSCGGVNVKKLEIMGINHHEIPDIENKSVRTVVYTSKVLQKIIKKENITVLHTHHRMAAFYVALLGLYKKCYFINTCHNTFKNKKMLTRFAYKHAHLIACGEMVKRNLVDFFALSDERVTVIHNAVKPFDEKIIEDNLIKRLHTEGYFVVGNVGRLSEQKGIEYYIQSIPDVLKAHSKVSFLIIGSGEEEKRLKELVQELGIENAVYFTGYRTDIQNLMMQLDLIVLSSLWEGLPLTLLEDFSVGKPVVATAVDGIIEIVEDGRSGMLVSPCSYSQIAEKINWAIEYPDRVREMSSVAKERFESEFSFEILRRSYINYYMSME